MKQAYYTCSQDFLKSQKITRKGRIPKIIAIPLVSAAVISSFVVFGPHFKCNQQTAVAASSAKETWRENICPAGCDSPESTMYVEKAYMVDRSEGKNFHRVFYTDETKRSVVLEGIGDDNKRVFRKAGAELVVATTKKQGNGWMLVDMYYGEKAEQFWQSVTN